MSWNWEEQYHSNLSLRFNGSDVEGHSLDITDLGFKWRRGSISFGLGSAHIRHIETRKQKRLDKGTNYTHFENLVAKSTHLKY